MYYNYYVIIVVVEQMMTCSGDIHFIVPNPNKIIIPLFGVLKHFTKMKL